VAGLQRTRRFDDERLDVFAPGVAHVSKQTLWQLSAVRALWYRRRALWQAPVPARMAFALKQTL
jgi:hypothetical protein